MIAKSEYEQRGAGLKAKITEFLTTTWPAPFSAKPHGVPPINGKLKDGPLAAMSYLKEKGYGDFLLHRTGHGIGQGNHEGLWVAEGGEHVLVENMVISVEPGIYIPDIGGVRHSDTVLITKDGYECLTTYPDDLESLTILETRLIKKLKGKAVQRYLGI